MKVLIDTNVLVSAILRDRDPEEVVLFVAGHSDFEWIVSSEIIEEYREVLSRKKFGLSEELLYKLFDIIEKLTTFVETDTVINFPRDQKDAMFLESALASNAQFLITGDKDFTQALKIVNTTVISVSMFKKIVCDTWDK